MVVERSPPADVVAPTGTAQLRLWLPTVEAWTRQHGGHDAVLAYLAEQGVVVSKATLRKELKSYRRTMSDEERKAPPATEPWVAVAPPLGGTGAKAAPPADRLEQPVNQTPTPTATTAQPLSVLSGVLDPKRRSSVADEFMHVHEQPRLGRKKAEQ